MMGCQPEEASTLIVAIETLREFARRWRRYMDGCRRYDNIAIIAAVYTIRPPEHTRRVSTTRSISDAVNPVPDGRTTSTYLEQTAERFAELIGEVVLCVDGQIVLQNEHGVFASLVRGSSLGRLVMDDKTYG